MYHHLVNVVRHTSYLLLFIGILATLSSCSPERRIARIANKYNLAKSDTIFKKDTVVSEGAMRDTTIHYYQRDTLVLKENNMVLKYYYNIRDSTVYLRGECLPDTVYRTIPVAINSVNFKDNGFSFIKTFITGNIVSILMFITILYVLYKNRS